MNSHEHFPPVGSCLTDAGLAFMGLYDVLSDPLSSVVAIVKPEGCEKVFNAMLPWLGPTSALKDLHHPATCSCACSLRLATPYYLHLYMLGLKWIAEGRGEDSQAAVQVPAGAIALVQISAQLQAEWDGCDSELPCLCTGTVSDHSEGGRGCLEGKVCWQPG